MAVNTHDTNPHPKHPTETPTGDPNPPDSTADPALNNTEPCEALPLMTPPLSTSWMLEATKSLFQCTL